MTTHENFDETTQFFALNDYFGGTKENFIFFKQSMLPAVSLEGKILMKSKSEICMSPNGNGALLNAVGINQEVKSYVNQLDFVQIIGVDNVLNKVLDPLHLGFSIDRNYELSMKTCEKRNASEKVGVIGKSNGKYQVIEYTELSDALRNETEEDGKTLKFRHG